MANKCPVCGNEYMRVSKCLAAQSRCVNGHEWHTCTVHKKIVIGQRGSDIPYDVCTCEFPIKKAFIHLDQKDKKFFKNAFIGSIIPHKDKKLIELHFKNETGNAFKVKVTW